MTEATPEATATTELRAALGELGLSRTYQSDVDGMSTVSVWSNLTVWCAGGVFFWRTGYDFRDFAIHPAYDPPGAAVKVKARYEELRERRDLFDPAREEAGT